MKKIGIAQWGTKHGHAQGWLELLIKSKEIKFFGVYESDQQRIEQLKNSKEKIWSEVKWINDSNEILENNEIKAVFIEESNDKSLDILEKCINADKNIMLDKPAGNNYLKFKKIMNMAKKKDLIIELGYMFRQHDGFRKIANMSKSGILGKIYMIRAHMSTNLPEENKNNNSISMKGLSKFSGGIFYDLAGHMIDQICWLLGRPNSINSFFKNSFSINKKFSDNTISVFEYDQALAIIDIAAMESPPIARRFEVYGSKGSAIMEPFEPADKIRLALKKSNENYKKGINIIKIIDKKRYDEPFNIFIDRLKKNNLPEFDLFHELLVQESLMRATK
ncbi:MAG: Gfo/Idh/MocA family oxidoreductase [Dehalococcoidia bacterium]|nr:Gfo/Idh/MocA family oxidoreductase [Dehalococcoidia bacterium]|tara:strand:- start:234 stop:1235 length:1002 start_codon:yes stop_codon:yes gene_type:complete